MRAGLGSISRIILRFVWWKIFVFYCVLEWKVVDFVSMVG